ncbi:MAG TPA: helix-turn-helix transcriptional regulator [Beijerinckiaceae bacterium]|jgi:DNA-binding CsgD family transcriptional regulator
MMSHHQTVACIAKGILPSGRRSDVFDSPCSSNACDGAILDGLRAALDRLEHGTILVDDDATLLFANASALELLSSRRGLMISGGKLRGESSLMTTILRNVIARCASCQRRSAEGATMLHCRIGDPALLVVATPVASARPHQQGSGLVTLLIVDPTRVSLPSADALRQQFGLTRTEANVAVDIISGDGLKATAERLGISVVTTRSHLRQIFAKTGVRRQAELVRLLLSTRYPLRQASAP